MSLPVRLHDVIEHVDVLSSEWHAYMHRRTGDIKAFSDELEMLADTDLADAPDWQRAVYEDEVRPVLESTDDYIALPGPMDFHQWEVMDDFCRTIDTPELRQRLLDGIRGKGAFRRFRDITDEASLTERWYSYRNRVMREMVIEFLDEQGIAWTDDATSEDAAS